ncbi:MAG: alkaline shock response membrane anchor protein AmaP [Clostridiaceae bacterium]|nr:alkaline shock response membrane anchor protein AmaP [Clostridiaceae bacterium]
MNNIFTRSMMILLALLYIITAVFIMIIALNSQVLTNTYFFLENLDRSSFLVGAAIVSLILLLSALVFLILGIKPGKDKKYVSRTTNMGEVRISFVTMQNVVMNAAGSFGELKNIIVSILNDGENISVDVKSHIMPGVSIPDLSQQVQERVKLAIEESTGVTVNNVRVYIEGIYQENPARNSVEPRHFSR